MPVIYKSTSYADTPRDAVRIPRIDASEHVFDSICDRSKQVIRILILKVSDYPYSIPLTISKLKCKVSFGPLYLKLRFSNRSLIYSCFQVMEVDF